MTRFALAAVLALALGSQADAQYVYGSNYYYPGAVYPAAYAAPYYGTGYYAPVVTSGYYAPSYYPAYYAPAYTTGYYAAPRGGLLGWRRW